MSHSGRRFQTHSDANSDKKRVRTVYATSTGATTAEATLEVYAPGFKGILVIPRRHIFHTPAPELCVTRLVLCSNFNPEDPRSCQMGNRCKFVHAKTTHAIQHDVHVNYAWRSVEEVTYPCYSESEGMLDVAPPNGHVAEVSIPAQYVLRTNALASSRRPLSHCAHYFYNRACNRGMECNFIHAVYIDPEARDHQRAPVPSQSNGRIPRPNTRSSYYDRNEDVLVEKPQRQRKVIKHMMEQNTCETNNAYLAQCTSCSSEDAQVFSASSDGDYANSSSNTSTPRDHAASTCSDLSEGSRFRYDPYNMNSAIQVVA